MPSRKRPLKILFVTDPLTRFDPVAETTLYLMKEADRRGHGVYVTNSTGLSARGKGVWAQIQVIEVQEVGKKDWYRVKQTSKAELKSFDAILLRKDPPFDMNYLHHLYLLDMVAGEVYMMNHPGGILMANEKLFPLPFTRIVPETLISADLKELLEFIQNHPQGTILKPLEEAGGRGVFYLRNPKADNIRVLLETATQGFSRHVVAQAYLSAARQGDKRIMLVGPEILGAFLRKPAPGEHRANLHAGGKAVPASVTRRDRELVKRLCPTLAKLGLDFVGLDLIGDRLIEVNVTSPMGIHEINQTSQKKSEDQVLDFIEKKVR